MAGWTVVDARIGRLAFEPMISAGFRLQADLSVLGGLATLGLTSPLRVERAVVRFTGPSGFDYNTLSASDQTRRFDLAPDAREIDAEIGWTTLVGAARLTLGTAYAVNAGNQRGAVNAGAWGRLSTPF